MEQKSLASQEHFISSIKTPLIFLLVLWIIFVVQISFDLDIGFLGVFPRNISGLKGILFSPLIHANFSHLISNSFPLFVLSVIIWYFYRRVAVRSFVMIYFLTGLSVWLMARSVFHIGASGVVYGLLAFIFWNGIFRRNVKSIVLALIVMVFFNGMFAGILPNQEGISWESHLYGAIMGIFTAYYYKEELEADEYKKEYDWEKEPELADRPYFFNRDVFEKTKAEREEEARAAKERNDFGDWISDITWEE